jgi:hypothetical protein
MAYSKRGGHWESLIEENINLITEHLNITSTIRLAIYNRDLCRRIGYNKGTRFHFHHWDVPFLLMPQPAHRFDDHWDEARENHEHDKVYDVVPLDHPRRIAVLPFMCERFWGGMNGDWLATHDWCGVCCLMNIYTEQQIDLPSSATCNIWCSQNEIAGPLEMYYKNWGP